MSHSLVMAGLGPAISFPEARPEQLKRDFRAKPGNDNACIS